MKEAFLAALLSIGYNPEVEIRLMEMVTPVRDTAGVVTTIRTYVPAMTATANKAGVRPHVVRHING